MSKIKEIENNLKIAEKRLQRSKIIVFVAIIGLLLVITSTFLEAAEDSRYVISQEHSESLSIQIQGDSDAELREAERYCSRLFLPALCKRYVESAKTMDQAFMIYYRAIVTLLKEGADEANRELERLLDDLEAGIPITKKKEKWL